MIDLIFNWWNLAVLTLGSIATYWCKKKYDETKSRPLLTSLPGFWTSLGLLGTFGAICYSLHDLNNIPEVIDNTGKTVAEVKAAGGQGLDIMKIISELVPAFTTSIIGLLGALAVTIWSKKKFAEEDINSNNKLLNKSPEEYIRDIAIKMNNLIPAQNELLVELIRLGKKEEINNREYNNRLNNNISNQSQNLKQSIEELVKLYKEQKEQTRVYNDRLNSNISNQSQILKDFIDGFVNRMDGIFQQMQGAIQQQIHTFGEEQFTKTSEILTSITERLSSISSGIMDNQLNSVQTMMSNTNTELVSISQKVTEELSNLTKELQGSLSNLSSVQSDRLDGIMKKYDELATELSEQNSKFAANISAQFHREYEEVQQHNVNSLQQMVDLKNAYQEATSEVMASTINMNQQITDDLRSSLSSFVNDLQTNITNQSSALSDAISTNVKLLQEAYSFIENHIAEIKQNYDQSTLAYADAISNVHQSNANTEKTISATNKSLEFVEETNKKIKEILDIIDNRQDNIEKLTKQINSISSVIVQLQKLESILNKITNK